MKKTIKTSCISILCFFASFHSALAGGPCTTFSGTMDPAPVISCGLAPVNLPLPQDYILDADDIILFYLVGDPLDPFTTTIATNSTPSFEFSSATMQSGQTYYVVVIAGNQVGGVVDQGDPCLSISQGTPVIFADNLTAGIFPTSQTLDCSHTYATLTASGGATYAWSGGLGTSTTATVNLTNTPVTSTYTVTATAANGCTDTATIVVTVNNSVPTAVINPFSVTLNCITTSATITASGAATYSWSGALGPTATATVNLTNTPLTTNYTVTATAANGCTDTATITVTVNNSVPTAVITPPSVTLNCNITSANITASGGVAYLWAGGLGSSATTTINLTNTPISSSYTVTVTSSNGCTDTATIAVTVNNSVPTAVITPPSITLNCYNPSATMTASGGVSYVWSGGLGADLTGLAYLNLTNTPISTTYTVTVTDSNGCSDSETIAVSVNAVYPTAVISAPTTVLTCTTPSIVLTASGGVSYTWGGGTPSGANTTVYLAGTYVVTVTAANACTDTETIAITQNIVQPVPVLTIVDDCNQDNNGAINLVPLSGGNYTYDWSNDGPETPDNDMPDISGLSIGTYTLTVTNVNNGCTGSSSATVQSAPTAVMSGSSTICAGESASIVINFTGNPPFSFVYAENGVPLSPITTNSNHYLLNVSPSFTTTYTLTAASNTCPATVSGSATILVMSMPQLNLVESICQGGIFNFQGIEYSIGAYNFVIPGFNGDCDTLVNLVVNELPNIVINHNDTICQGETFTFGGQSYNTSGTYTIVWPGMNGQCDTFVNLNLSYPAPPIQNLQFTCDGTAEHYTASFDFDGVNPPYTVEGIDGTITGNTFQSVPFPSGGSYIAQITDGTGCQSADLEISHLCDCLSDAGTIPPGVTQNCQSVIAQVASNFTLDDNDVITYILSDEEIFPTPDNFLAMQPTPEFSLIGLNPGQLYFIFAAVANDDGTGKVDFSDPCYDSSNFISFTAFENVVSDIVVTADITQPATCNSADGVISLNVSGGTPPYDVLWNDDATGLIHNGLDIGDWNAFITDNTGCTTYFDTTLVPQSGFPECTIAQSNPLNCQHPSVTLSLDCQVSSNYAIEWFLDGVSQGSGTTFETLTEGAYSVDISDLVTGCPGTAALSLDFDTTGCSQNITGLVILDNNDNCINNPGEPGITGWIVKASSASADYFAVTQPGGYFSFSAPYGNYHVSVMAPNPSWDICPQTQTANVNGPGAIANLTFKAADTMYCPNMEVVLMPSNFRPCMNTWICMQWHNLSAFPATDVSILVTFDENLIFNPATSTYPVVNAGGNSWLFNIGTVNAMGNGVIYLNLTVSCDAVVGQTLCSQAHIFPDSLCGQTAWNGGFLNVQGLCEPDSVAFIIENAGGNMTAPAHYIVLEDGTQISSGDVMLDAAETTARRFPANGSTYVLKFDAIPGEPTANAPTVFVEGCGTNGQGGSSTGFALQFPANDAAAFIDFQCTQVTSSYDPNDKTGYPLGYGEDHFIERGTDIEYVIRFQNTGNDTAFTVVVRDVISPDLDLGSIRELISNHDYVWDIHYDTLIFTFKNILLPDSTTNEPESHGVIKFRISQQDGLANGTVIENSAAIYFDYNDPVLTNTTFHTIGEQFITVKTEEIPGIQTRVYPNPADETVTFEINGNYGNNYLLQIYDLQGNVRLEKHVSGKSCLVSCGTLPAGMYAYKVTAQKGEVVAQGKLVKAK